MKFGMGRKDKESFVNREELEAQRQEAIRTELGSLEQRFATEMLALEKFEPIVVGLEGGKHLHSILKSIEERFLGHSLDVFFDVSWSLTLEQVIISSNFSRVGSRSFILKSLETYHKSLNAWLNTPNKDASLRVFLQIKVENENLRAQVKELESKLETVCKNEPRWPTPLSMMMHGGGPFGIW